MPPLRTEHAMQLAAPRPISFDAAPTLQELSVDDVWQSVRALGVLPR